MGSLNTSRVRMRRAAAAVVVCLLLGLLPAALCPACLVRCRNADRSRSAISHRRGRLPAQRPRCPPRFPPRRRPSSPRWTGREKGQRGRNRIGASGVGFEAESGDGTGASRLNGLAALLAQAPPTTVPNTSIKVPDRTTTTVPDRPNTTVPPPQTTTTLPLTTTTMPGRHRPRSPRPLRRCHLLRDHCPRDHDHGSGDHHRATHDHHGASDHHHRSENRGPEQVPLRLPHDLPSSGRVRQRILLGAPRRRGKAPCRERPHGSEDEPGCGSPRHGRRSSTAASSRGPRSGSATTTGWSSHYIHLNNDPATDDGRGEGGGPALRKETESREGELIGWAGDSGNAEETIPHLHFELRNPGAEAVDPEPSPQGRQASQGLFRWAVARLHRHRRSSPEMMINLLASAGMATSWRPQPQFLARQGRHRAGVA